MKYFHNNYPFTFALVFLIIYAILDFSDAKMVIPKLAKKSTSVDNWITILKTDKETK